MWMGLSHCSMLCPGSKVYLSRGLGYYVLLLVDLQTSKLDGLLSCETVVLRSLINEVHISLEFCNLFQSPMLDIEKKLFQIYINIL